MMFVGEGQLSTRRLTGLSYHSAGLYGSSMGTWLKKMWIFNGIANFIFCQIFFIIINLLIYF